MTNFDKCSDKAASLEGLYDANGWIEPELPANDGNYIGPIKVEDDDPPEFDDVFEIIANFELPLAPQNIRQKLLYNSERRVLYEEAFTTPFMPKQEASSGSE